MNESKSRDTRSEATPRLRRFRRWALFLFLLFLGGMIFMVWWYRRERGPELRLSAAQVIPADRWAAYVEFHQAREFLDLLQSTPAIREGRNGDRTAQIDEWKDELLSNSALLDKIPGYLGASGWSDVFDRVIGDSVTLILLDINDTASSEFKGSNRRSQPVVLLWMRPRLGWRGELATVLAPLAGGSKVESVRSETGARFYSYRDSRHPGQGVAWTRLGSTFLVRLDSPDPAPFEEILDWATERETAENTRVDTSETTGTMNGDREESDLPLASLPAFEAMSETHSSKPGLWGLAKGPETFQLLDQLIPQGLSRWVDPAWIPAVREQLQEFPLLALESDLSPERGFSLNFDWFEKPARAIDRNRVVERMERGEAVSRQPTGNEESASTDSSMIRLRAESRRVPEVVHWITLITRSVSQASEEEGSEEETKQTTREKAGERIAPPPMTREEKDRLKKEHRIQKERRRALLRELAEPFVTARLVSALGPWMELDISTAGLSSEGRWKPDWDFTADGADDPRLRKEAADFFSAVRHRDSEAALRAFPALSTTEHPAGQASLGEPIGSDNILLHSTAPFAMNLRAGRFIVQLPGGGILRIGLHRYRLPGEPAEAGPLGYGESTARRTPPNPAAGSAPGLNDESTTPAVALTVDWSRLAENLTALIHESRDNPKLPEVRKGVVVFRDLAETLALTGTTRFLILPRTNGVEWSLYIPLGS